MARPPLTAEALPLYAAPFDRTPPARVHFTSAPHHNHTRVYGPQTVARELPWLDAVERWMLAYNRWHATVAMPVTRLNSTISSRVNRPAPDVDEALAALAAGGPRQVSGSRVEFAGPDPSGGQRLRVHLPWSRPPLVAVVGTRPWSSGRCDLVLELARSRRARFPRRWFPAGHAIVDDLRRLVG